MEIKQLLSNECIVCNVSVSSKKRALEAVSNLLAEISGIELSEVEIFDGLIARERLGSTGLGHGVAIPHGRFKGIEQTVAVFIKFEQRIDFDAVDGEPVDLVFALMVPEECTDEHLKLLANLAEMFSNPALRERIRQSNTSEEIASVFERWQPGDERVVSAI